MKLNIKIFAFFAVIIILSFYCNREQNVPPDFSPPSNKTFYFPIDFLQIDSSLLNSNDPEDTLYRNWLNASRRYSYWSNYINDEVGMAIAALKNIRFAEVNFFANSTWTWTFDFEYNDEKYDGILYGTLTGSKIIWELYFYENDREKLLAYGEEITEPEQGYWILYHNVIQPYPKLKITWKNYKIADTTFVYTETNIDTNSLQFGNYMKIAEFDTTPELNITVFFGNPIKSYIRLDTLTFRGAIKDYNFFFDNFWHCWNKDKENINCEKP